MADQNIKVRHIQKHDTEENWNKAVNFIPKQGEIIIYDVDSNYNYERMKVGDGITLVSSLPFIDAQKQDKLTFDDVPTVESTNPVTSEGIKTALDLKLDKTDAVGKKTAEGGEIFNSATSAGNGAHAEGSGSATGVYSHAEGASTTASGSYSHAEGSGAQAMADYSHAEGYNSAVRADANFAHVEGWYTVAASPYQHVQGKCNIVDNTNTYAHIVGNGNNPMELSNAHTLDWNGNAWYKGNIKIGGTSYNDSNAKTLATTDDLNNYQEKLTFDTTPTTDSTNPVTSGGVRSALDLKADKTNTLSGYGITDAYTKTEIDELLNNKAKKPVVATITIPTTGWTTSRDTNGTTYYSINITDSILTSTGYPITDVVLPNDIAAARLQSEAYQNINKITVNDGSVKLYCFDSLPTVSFQIRIQILYI